MPTSTTRTVTLTWAGSGGSFRSTVTETVDQVSSLAIQNIQVIQGASEAIQFGDVTDPSIILFKNENPAWATLSAGAKAGYSGEADYNTKNTVHLGTLNPTTAVNASVSLRPQSGAMAPTVMPVWYACKSTDNVNLLVSAAQR